MCQTWRCIIQRIELRIYKEFPQISKRYKQQTVNKQRCKLQICRGRTANGQRLKKRWSDSLIMKYKSGDAVSHPWECHLLVIKLAKAFQKIYILRGIYKCSKVNAIEKW